MHVPNEIKTHHLVWGYVSIGKSALAQLLVFQELFQDKWVLLHFKGSTSLLAAIMWIVLPFGVKPRDYSRPTLVLFKTNASPRFDFILQYVRF